MNGLAKYLENIYISCKIPFELYIDNNRIYTADPKLFKGEVLETNFIVGHSNYTLRVSEGHDDFVNLIKFFIKDKFVESNTNSEKVLLKILNNNDVSKESIEEYIPLRSETFMIVVNVSEKLNEALEIIKNIYSSTKALVVSNNEYIILLGNFENIVEHTSSINETLYTSIYEKCYIGYLNIKSYDQIKGFYDEMVHDIELAKKYNISKMILDENSLIFEKFMDGLDENIKKSIALSFDEGFSKFDNDMIKTIDVFFELDLNLSEAAKSLYVHRNTLIYRLDKIQKYTKYDIRKFKDAVIFKIAFSIWKQRHNK
ncbi:helix-turn-helix domain-containing protein [Clostridium sp. SM-530-WT-3G]|uniref:PucR family transcriptional regulator n=1 Tax=Clostridium sp. SM-530-WT-3G TaxID=2725303 RepID=UPI00145D340B|nr:helix-turn-helix domain-containing protein [Clostridium sp. SM-530-WT-3G]NME82983.1 PucR family transcriptional regulator [Clostridium sp. SM-530-WT-3G]